MSKDKDAEEVGLNELFGIVTGMAKAAYDTSNETENEVDRLVAESMGVAFHEVAIIIKKKLEA